jgi:hypothetical protein
VGGAVGGDEGFPDRGDPVVEGVHLHGRAVHVQPARPVGDVFEEHAAFLQGTLVTLRESVRPGRVDHRRQPAPEHPHRHSLRHLHHRPDQTIRDVLLHSTQGGRDQLRMPRRDVRVRERGEHGREPVDQHVRPIHQLLRRILRDPQRRRDLQPHRPSHHHRRHPTRTRKLRPHIPVDELQPLRLEHGHHRIRIHDQIDPVTRRHIPLATFDTIND